MGNWTYTYDDFNRLSTATAAPPWAGWDIGGVENMGCQYTYDRYGNRLSEQPYGSGKSCLSTSYTYSNNRITTPGVVLDAAGNVTQDIQGNVYSYDAENRLVSMASRISGTNVITSYQYDPEGNRVTSTNSNGVTTLFGHDSNGQLLWTNYGSGTPQEIWFNGRHIGYLYTNSDGSLNRVLYSSVDQVGTERVRVEQNQTILSKFISLPFSESSYSTGTNDDTIHFTGKEHDAESGNDYFGARYYASGVGRFMSPDPSGLLYANPTNPQNLNLYAYTLNNPLTFLDPSGLALQLNCQNDPDVVVNTTDANGNATTTVSGGAQHCTVSDDGMNALTISIPQQRYQQFKPPSRAPNKTSSNKDCRVKQGVLGGANLVLAGAKTSALIGADALLVTATPFTGGASAAVAAVGTVYGVTSIGGQTITGSAQLYTAFGGNPEAAEELSQAGDILSGPILGISTLIATGNVAQAQQNANVESVITAGAGLAKNKGFLEAVDFGLSLVGLSGAGCPP